MRIWALSDLHLTHSVPSKSMEIFGEKWEKYHEKIEKNWKKTVAGEDIVLIAGDISWAASLDIAMIDLLWIDSLPGTKVILKGNHDYWWPSMSKLEKALPSSIKAIYNNALLFGDVAIAGTRLWETSEYSFGEYIDVRGKIAEKQKGEMEERERIYDRELIRLENSLSCMNKNAKIKIAMTHFPPIGGTLAPSRACKILEKHQISYAVFGHLHSLKKGASLFGEKDGVTYIFSSCDEVNFTPVPVCKV